VFFLAIKTTNFQINQSNNTVLTLVLFSVCEDIGIDRLCGLVSEFLGTHSEVLSSIHSASRFSENSGSGTGSTQPCEDN
jgi:hypothetical protein